MVIRRTEKSANRIQFSDDNPTTSVKSWILCKLAIRLEIFKNQNPSTTLRDMEISRRELKIWPESGVSAFGILTRMRVALKI